MAEENTLEDIKRLLILLLIKLDATSEELALALRTDSSNVRRMIPSRQVKRVAKAMDD